MDVHNPLNLSLFERIFATFNITYLLILYKFNHCIGSLQFCPNISLHFLK